MPRWILELDAGGVGRTFICSLHRTHGDNHQREQTGERAHRPELALGNHLHIGYLLLNIHLVLRAFPVSGCRRVHAGELLVSAANETEKYPQRG
jgi:hypothetical protein